MLIDAAQLSRSLNVSLWGDAIHSRMRIVLAKINGHQQDQDLVLAKILPSMCKWSSYFNHVHYKSGLDCTSEAT